MPLPPLFSQKRQLFFKHCQFLKQSNAIYYFKLGMFFALYKSIRKNDMKFLVEKSREKKSKWKMVCVDWFDALKGIGEGKTRYGETIFLNTSHMETNGNYFKLKPKKWIWVKVKIISDKVIAEEIKDMV